MPMRSRKSSTHATRNKFAQLVSRFEASEAVDVDLVDYH